MDNGYPKYKRPNNGRTCSKRVKNRLVQVDNRYVVPYNPVLLMRYKCHINVEVCSTVKAVKYLYKYITKGVDRALAEVGLHDEIKHFQEHRYVSAIEACYRIFGFTLHGNSCTIVRLQLHLPKAQNVVFEPTDPLVNILQNNEDTMLTEYFKTCRNSIEARQYTYVKFPEHYTWNRSSRTWNKRRRGGSNTVGRLYSASPSEGERFYLRILLIHVAGPSSFEDLRTYQGI